MFDISLSNRSSTAIDHLIVNPLIGDVIVQFKNGYAYHYTNVSRKAIINLTANPNMSLGSWVNANCVRDKRTTSTKLFTV